MFFDVILILAALYLFAVAFLYYLQHTFVWKPGYRPITTTPAFLGLPFEDVDFTAEDGTKLRGWYIPREKARGTALFCHGNAGNISNRMHTIERINQLGFNLFIFDYRGFGESESKKITEEGTYQDAQAAWNYLLAEKHLKPEEIVIWARSLGCAIASHLASHTTPQAVILESGFISVEEVGVDAYPFLPIRQLNHIKYPTQEHIKKIKAPILILHSPDDEVIRYRHGQSNFEAANEPKAFLEISGVHSDGFYYCGDVFLKGVEAFLTKHLSSK